MLWGMGQMGPVLVSVSFTLNSVIKRVTKPPSVNPVRGCVILTQWLVHQRAETTSQKSSNTGRA